MGENDSDGEEEKWKDLGYGLQIGYFWGVQSTIALDVKLS